MNSSLSLGHVLKTFKPAVIKHQKSQPDPCELANTGISNLLNITTLFQTYEWGQL